MEECCLSGYICVHLDCLVISHSIEAVIVYKGKKYGLAFLSAVSITEIRKIRPGM